MYKNILQKTTNNQELTEQEIFQLIRAINNDEVSDVQIAGFQVALLIVLNAAGALKVGGKAASFEEGIALANKLIDSGAAAEKLNQLREMSNSFGAN